MIVKGLHMPIGCADCPLRSGWDVCQATGREIDPLTDERMEWCPLCDEDTASEVVCPFRTRREQTVDPFIWAEGYAEYFMPCLKEGCPCYKDWGDYAVCTRDNVELTLWEREHNEHTD